MMRFLSSSAYIFPHYGYSMKRLLIISILCKQALSISFKLFRKFIPNEPLTAVSDGIEATEPKRSSVVHLFSDFDGPVLLAGP